jgi:hypothetical protein
MNYSDVNFRVAVDYDSPEPATSTKDAPPLCRAWVENCDAHHGNCKVGRGSTIPTRLIAIDDGDIRIVNLSGHIHGGIRYATLSHCWVSLKFVTLMTGNIQQFRKTIPPDAMPKTFRDAVGICRYLGFKYLWIYSLCILQDSTEDWDKESRDMAQVYGDADLNIAATSADDASVGCFFHRTRD